VDGTKDDAENRVSNDTSVVLLIYKIILPGKANTLPARPLALYGSGLNHSTTPFDVSRMNRVPTRSACSSEWVIQMMALRALF